MLENATTGEKVSPGRGTLGKKSIRARNRSSTSLKPERDPGTKNHRECDLVLDSIRTNCDHRWKREEEFRS